jgi:hypothetical protein
VILIDWATLGFADVRAITASNGEAFTIDAVEKLRWRALLPIRV